MKSKKNKIEKLAVLIVASLIVIVLGIFGCSNDSQDEIDTSVGTIVKVNSENFIAAGLAEPISVVSKTLSNGTTADCYKIVSKGTPADHSMGPWCPTNISDDATEGGIWLKDGNVYDVDGAFIKNLATFFSDPTWMMYKTSTGEVIRTKTQAECQAAANPNVGAEYKNFCVECLPSYIANLTQTYYIPVSPVKLINSVQFGMGPGSTGPSVRGIAFNGVRFDAPAPVNNILAAYTLAPFDDAGGHINLAAGYHYHAANGKSKEIAQTDGHAPMIGYAIDGHGLYARLDTKGVESTDLDECRGHTDAVRGYHYHVDKAGANNFINCLKGAYVN
jgi:YHYH protein